MLQKLTESQVRMMALADHIESLPRERFDLSVWARNGSSRSHKSYPQTPEALVKIARRPEKECGTVACLAGHAIMLYHDLVPAALQELDAEGQNSDFTAVA